MKTTKAAGRGRAAPVNPLAAILQPGSIAVVGASNNPLKMGSMQLMNLLHCRYPGEILPVHPEEETVCGLRAYPRIEDLPHAPELAMLVVPTRLVTEMLAAFGRLGTRQAVIISAGFKETGTDGVQLEQELLSIAARHGMRFLGPNCLGIVNAHHPLNITAAPLLDPPGYLSLASQSGTYVAQTRLLLQRQGVRLGKAISVGNEASIDLVDCLEYLGDDDQTRAIGLYIECIRRPGRFLETAGRISRHKPIIAQYVGGTRAGARSGASHTGAMAGPDFIYDGLFEQCGVIRVETIEEVYRFGHALACQPIPPGERIAVLTNSGGPGTAMASRLDAEGLRVPEFSESLQRELRKTLPGHASARNPVDLTFHVDMVPMTQTLPRLLMASGEVDGLLVHGIIDTGWAEMFHPVFSERFDTSREQLRQALRADLDEIVAMPRRYGKPIIASSFFGREDHVVSTFHAEGLPTFDSPEKAAAAMACLCQYGRIRRQPPDDPESDRETPEAARRIMHGRAGQPLDEFEAKALLRAYGVATCREQRVHSREEAVAAAAALGYPVAVKVCSPEVAHKTEAGGVHLNLAGPEAVEEACRSIRARMPQGPLLVSEMVAGDREFMAGVTRPAGFPACVLFALGGVWAEALPRRAVRLVPFGRHQARALIASLKTPGLLQGARGRAPLDTDALAALLIALGHIALDFPGLREIDLNPIVICGGQPIVVDALLLA